MNLNNMKILQVIPDLGLGGGAEVMCQSLSKELLKERGNEIVVATLFSWHTKITDDLEKEGISVYFLDKKHGVDLSLVPKLYRIIKKHKIDVVHTHRYALQYAVPAAIMAGVKMRVHTVHNVADKEMGKNKRLLAKTFYRFFHVVPVAISPIIKDSISYEYKLKAEKIPMIYNGIDLAKCKEKMLYDLSTPVEVVHLGRMTNQKNQMEIFKAASILKDRNLNIHFSLYGEGELENDYKRAVLRMKLENEISFCGLSDNIYPILQKADIFILPSKYEGMPISLIEAMGSALPIIASNVGGIPDMISDGENGIIISPNANDLADAISRLIKDQDLRQILGHKAKQDSNRFSSYFMAQEYLNVYKEKRE